MAQPVFVLKYLPQNRTKYQLLTLLPPLACLLLLLFLCGSGIIPNENNFSYLLLLIPFELLRVLTYRFIIRKIHNIAVYDDRLVESGWRGKEYVIYLSTVKSIRTNWLGEVILIDASGKTLLCIEENLENRERLINQLQSLVQ